MLFVYSFYCGVWRAQSLDCIGSHYYLRAVWVYSLHPQRNVRQTFQQKYWRVILTLFSFSASPFFGWVALLEGTERDRRGRWWVKYPVGGAVSLGRRKTAGLAECASLRGER